MKWASGIKRVLRRKYGSKIVQITELQQTIRERSADSSLFPMSSSSTASEGGKDDIIISDEKSVPQN